MNQEKHVIIFHAISPGMYCDDGFGAALVAYNVLTDKILNSETPIVLLQEGIYGKEPEVSAIDENTTVHILDFSYPVEILNQIGAQANKVILLDHHKTAVEHWEIEKNSYAFRDRDIIKFDMARSGAKMAWDFYTFGCEPEPSLITHIQDNDLWQFKHKATKDFINVLRSYPQTIEAWNKIVRDTYDADGYTKFMEQAEPISRYYNQKLQEIIATSKESCNILNNQGLCCNAPKMFASDIGHILAKESGTFGATYFKKADGTTEWSLRSANDFDVSALAKAFGGGGHLKAAGFSVYANEEDNTTIKIGKPYG